ncbi:MAG: hypothetical protein M0R77_01165 [Gammaproteobacteria bacterium]|nr:hypothetical protein [Acholeplasmataceae bacterium]MCK9529166.1 hypothetical protein [Gammaproteobacteria bacterium]
MSLQHSLFHPSIIVPEISQRLENPTVAVKRSVLEALLNEAKEEGQLPIITDKVFIERILNTMIFNLEVVERKEIEKNFNYIHPVVYSPIIELNEEGALSLFTYQRAKGIGEERLLGNYSVGIGGHVEFDTGTVNTLSLLVDNNEDLFRLVFDKVCGLTLLTEFSEEIKELQYLLQLSFKEILEVSKTHPFLRSLMNCVDSMSSDYPDMLIYDTSNEVGRVHLGITTLVPYITDIIKPDPGIHMGEDSLITKGFLSFDELKDNSIEEKMESWSQLIVGQMAKYNRRWAAVVKEKIYFTKTELRDIKIGTVDSKTGLNANIDFTPR